MRNISSWSIKNPIPIILLFLLLTIAGLAGFRSMRINNNPDVDFPFVVVTAVRPGAAPSELETQVTRLIEDSIAGLGQVRHINSTVVDGASTTFIEFELGVDHEQVTNDVRNAMSNLRGALPQDMQEPIVNRIDVTGGGLITYVVKAPSLTPEQRSWFVDNEVSRTLLAIKGVRQVNRQGGVDREIEVALDPDRLAARGVTAAAVSQALVSSNADLPGGRVTVSGSERAIRTLGAAGSIEQLRETRVPLSSGGTVRLADLGTVTDHWAEPRSRARYDGQEVVTFNMVRGRGASEVQTAQKVRKAIEKLDAARPELEIKEITSNVKYIEESYLASMEALIVGAILAVLVVLLFLRDWRATLLAAVAIPASLFPTFAILAPMGQSLNGITLLALSLTVGILVDDAIVEIENIVRHMRGGKSPYSAAMEAADEIGLAVVATTFTIVAVFAPVGFMPGIIGKFFQAFALAACISVLFSLVVARLLTPLMGAYMLKADAKHEDKDPPWMGPYLKSLDWGLNNRWKVLWMGVPMFGLSIYLATLLPFEFQPQVDRGRAEFSIELPPGATLNETDAIVQRVTRELRARKEVVSVYAAVGSNNAVNKASVTADLTDKGERISQKVFSRQMVDQFAAIPGARIGAGSNNGGGPSNGGSYTLSLVSDNGPALEAAARKVEAEMRSVPGLAHVVNTAAIARPEIVVTPKPDQAARAGVTAGAISQAVRVATIGDVDQNLPKYNLGDRQVPIRLRLDESARADIAVLQTLKVPSPNGPVPLNAVADIRFGAGPSQIERQDRARVATITAELDGIVVGEAAKRVHDLPSVKNLPPGVKEVAAGDAEFIQEMVTGFLGALITGILLMYVVLVLLFRSFAHPITIMVALPLAIGGAFGLLVLAKSSFSISTLIGILMLMGIAAKNSILLVEYAIMAMKEQGMDKRTAIIDAAHKRARPILMTTVAMGAGMLPTAVGLGAEVEFRAPMAIAVIGGLITSTLLSLLYIPVVFVLMDGLKVRAERLMARVFGGQHHVAAKKPLVE
ncbi:MULTISPECIES: efflux RND transporter permease subunit [unclassified Caulobacter]|uniref:efflux RND transporter permease subunit n=1 Tax=unclassified Caulobacter TaxID=2648921 RepID=UPI000780DF07|nr:MULTISPECIES: efflux RND transporter permease subunit [unclassified Caulobacter]AZS22577.1 efflux RND transporter permease subunit [Caulobacter sp. FWC26]